MTAIRPILSLEEQAVKMSGISSAQTTPANSLRVNSLLETSSVTNP